MAARNFGEKNFWLWGTWGKRAIKQPFLTQKVDGKIRNVVIGQTFIVVLKEDGTLVSWGEDKVGCLGLGTESVTCPDPRKIPFPTDFQAKIIDIQHGKHHILALTSNGRVYSWGENQAGQLGLNDTQARYEPVFVEELRMETVTQILAVDNMSYALTNHGVVHAWGDNKEGALALEHDNPRVLKPEPMMRMKETPVKRLEIKEAGGAGGGKGGKTIIAYVELAEPWAPRDQIGGYDAPLGEPKEGGRGAEDSLTEGTEKDIFEGVDLMRKVMDNTQEWWNHMLDVRHGSPYDDNPTHANELAERGAAEDSCTALQLDTFVSLDNLEKASYELDMLIQSAKAQLLEIKQKRGTKNVKFMLSMFMDDCKLRREKIRRTVAARQLIDYKRSMPGGQEKMGGESNKDEITRLNTANTHLTKTLQRVRNLRVYDVFTKALQDSLIECIECKLVVHETQVEVLKAREGKAFDPLAPPLRTIKERWGALKHFSIYSLYQECNLRGQNVTFSSDDEMLAFLVQSSDSKIDQIIQIDRDKIISRDQMVPALCYDLLVENAELRKMCNTYQLKVLLMREGKDKPGAAAAH